MLPQTLVRSSDWVAYFDSNAADAVLPWDDTYRLSGAERVAVAASIQEFQLGENASGRRLLNRAQAWARRAGDSAYVAALRLFIGEEQRHSRTLARFLELHGIGCLRRHWVHGFFRWVRCLAGLELCMRVLATAEMIAVPYYSALRDATGSPLLRAICTRILEEEAAHLRFQTFTFRQFDARRSVAARRAVECVHRLFAVATATLVWFDHRSVFVAAGRSLRRLRRETLEQFELLTGRPSRAV